ncbi:RHTO0S10e01948g1_1 [Rhodotorula toruloides]|uniref:RHTO0S10e01948g1_1 n=2 Tax=Rhodotorula toruloides TaxID=5286 RepID=A0A061BAE5_RHOTO|nr:RHTO0S10e01948g1_1 [Rhodotorula toruloides]
MTRSWTRLAAIVPALAVPSAKNSSRPLSTFAAVPSPLAFPATMGSFSSAASQGRDDGAEILDSPSEWRAALSALPSLADLHDVLPTIFLAHGSPMLIHPPHLANARSGPLLSIQGPEGPLVAFLKDLGPLLMEKYTPRAIVVLSAHWETEGGGVVTDYGDKNPLLFDYYGFPKELYEVTFKSRGDKAIAQRVVQVLKEGGIESARLTNKLEPRGEDGRGFMGPGLDHGVFVPFKLMFKDEAPVPIIQVSIPSDLSPATQHALGAALSPLRREGILLIAGGLTVHTFRDFGSFSPAAAAEKYRVWEKAIVDAVAVKDPKARHRALFSLVHHPSFRSAHPREEHFVPLYVAQGAGETGNIEGREGARVVCGLWGSKTVVFGV